MSDPVTLFDAFNAGWNAHGAQQTPGGDSQEVTDAYVQWRAADAPKVGGCSRTPNTCKALFCGYPDCLMGSTTPATKETGTITAVSGNWVYWLGVGWRTTKPSPDAVAVNRTTTLQM